MRVVLQRFLGIIFLCLMSINAVEAKKVLPFNDIAKKVEQSRDAVEDIYYQLLKNHYFDDVNNPNDIYANNLIIGTNLDEDPVTKGAILLNLIIWLEKKNDRDSRFLLRKINRLYHLEFHRTLSALNNEAESYKDSLLSSFHDLSKYKTFNPSVGAIYPFGSSITRAILTLFVINKATISFDQKKESALYALEKIRQEMISINNNLSKDKIDEAIIRTFIFGLEKFGIKQTLVESKLFRNLVIGGIIAIIIAVLIYKWDLVSTGAKKSGEAVNEFLREMVKGIAGIFAEEIDEKLRINNRFDQLEHRMNEITSPQGVADLSRSAGQGLMDSVAVAAGGTWGGSFITTKEYAEQARKRIEDQEARQRAQAAVNVAQQGPQAAGLTANQAGSSVIPAPNSEPASDPVVTENPSQARGWLSWIPRPGLGWFRRSPDDSPVQEEQPQDYDGEGEEPEEPLDL